MFETYHQEHLDFKVCVSLKGIIVDQSDNGAKGLHEVIGEDTTELVLKDCNVYIGLDHIRVAEKVTPVKAVISKETDLEEQQMKPLL